jgi:hypothetical protein
MTTPQSELSLVQEYRRLINKHYNAVQTDTTLEYTDVWSLEEKARQFWAEFHTLERAFIQRLEAIDGK